MVSYEDVGNDHITRGIKLSCKILICGFILFSVLALLGYTTWPLGVFANARNLDLPRFLYSLFKPLSILFILVFFYSRPSKKEILYALLGWAFCIFMCFLFAKKRFHPELLYPTDFFITNLAIPCTIIYLIKYSKSPFTSYKIRFKWFVFQGILFLDVLPSALNFTTRINYNVMDIYAFNFDKIITDGLTFTLVSVIHAIPSGNTLMDWVYASVHFIPFILVIRQLHEKSDRVASIVLAWTIMALFGIISYMVFPITGPVFVFGSDFYNHFNQIKNLPLSTTILSTAPHNGMPSLHFGWTLLSTILWWQTTKNVLWRSIVFIYLILLGISTIYLGQHYLIDLIVAIPFTLGCLALASTTIPISAPIRRNTIIAGFLAWMIWIISLYYTYVFMRYLFAVNVLLLLTLIIVTYQSYNIRRLHMITLKTLQTRKKF